MIIAHAYQLDYCKQKNTVILTILNDFPFTNVNINNKQQCLKVHQEMNMVGT